MLVEIWSDVVCPWCYIGKRRFESALSRFEHAGDVEVLWRSFELDPQAPFRRSGSMAENLAAKYAMTVEEATLRLRSLDELAATEGLRYDLQRTQSGNTFDAHRLIHLANSYSPALGGEVKEALLHSYFEEFQPVSEPEVLTEVGVKAGLDLSEVEVLLAGDRFAADVRKDEAEASALGATGVPFFVIDRAFAVPGAQDSDTMLSVLQRAWDRSHPEIVGQGPVCDGDTCDIQG